MAHIMKQPPVTMHEYQSGTLVIIELGSDDGNARIALCRRSALATHVICTLTSIDMTLQSMKIDTKDACVWPINATTIPSLSNALNRYWLDLSKRQTRFQVEPTEHGSMAEDDEEIVFELNRYDDVDGHKLNFIDRIKLSMSLTSIRFMEAALNRVYFMKIAMTDRGHTMANYRVFNEYGLYLCSVFASNEMQAVHKAREIGVIDAARALKDDSEQVNSAALLVARHDSHS